MNSNKTDFESLSLSLSLNHRASGQPCGGFDEPQLFARESIAVLADHCSSSVVGQSGRLLSRMSLGQGIQEAASEHVTRPIGVHCFDGDRGDMHSVAKLQNFTALRAHGQAHCLGKAL